MVDGPAQGASARQIVNRGGSCEGLNFALASLTGLEALAEVGDSLAVINNPVLPTSLAEELAYESIGEDHIGGDIYIYGNGPG